MAIFGLFLKSIFLVAILTAIFIFGIVVYLYLRVKRIARTFGGGSRARNGQQRQNSRTGTYGSATNGSSSATSGSSSSNSGQSQGGNGGATYVNEELYDQRSPQEANRKIFAKDEGEYVDFEETN